MLTSMQVLMLEPPKEFLAERRRNGADTRDEVWNGVLHVVPPASYAHQRFEFALAKVIDRIVTPRGWETSCNVGVFDPERPTRDYRVPDIIVALPKHVALERGVIGPAKLVVEILSPDDESRAKLPYYASRGVEEVWLVDRELRNVEVLVLREGVYVVSLPIDGVTPTDVLGVTLETVAGPRLRIAWRDGFADV